MRSICRAFTQLAISEGVPATAPSPTALATWSSEKTGELVAFKSVNDGNDLVIINKSGITLRIHVADIRVMGRATQGVRIINLDKRNDVIASVCCVDADPEEETVEVLDAEELPGLSDSDVEVDADEEEVLDEEPEDAQNEENE